MTPEEHIDAVITGVLEQAGSDAVEDIRETIATAFPPPSNPGESPHKRTGTLSDGVEYSVEQEGAITILLVVSTAPYSEYLEDGTENMRARPFMGPARDRWAPVIYQRFTEAFSTSSPVFAH